MLAFRVDAHVEKLGRVAALLQRQLTASAAPSPPPPEPQEHPPQQHQLKQQQQQQQQQLLLSAAAGAHAPGLALLPPLQTPTRVTAPSHLQAARVLVMAKTVALLTALTAAGVQGFASRAEAGGAAAATTTTTASGRAQEGAEAAANAMSPTMSFRAAEGDGGRDATRLYRTVS